jgi:hypothetical protein
MQAWRMQFKVTFFRNKDTWPMQNANSRLATSAHATPRHCAQLVANDLFGYFEANAIIFFLKVLHEIC